MDFFFEGAFAPGVVGDFYGVGEVALEDFVVLVGEVLVEDVEVGFFVEAEGAVVEVAGADAGPVVVDDHVFAVVACGLVFVDVDAGFEEFAPACDAGVADDLAVGVGAGDDDVDPDAALGGADEGFDEEVVGDEVGVADADAVAGGGDGEEEHEACAVGAFAGGAFEGLAAEGAVVGEGGEVEVAVEDFGAGLDPVVHEGLLELGDDGALDVVLGVAPEVGLVGVAVPVVAEADAADVACGAVDDEEFAVGAFVEAEVDVAEDFDFDAGLFHGVDFFAVEAVAADGVLEEVDFDALLGFGGEGVGELGADFAAGEDEVFHGDGVFGGFDGGEHGGEDFCAVFEDVDVVAFDEWWAEEVADGAFEFVVGNGVVGDDGFDDFFFAFEEVACEEDADGAAGECGEGEGGEA